MTTKIINDLPVSPAPIDDGIASRLFGLLSGFMQEGVMIPKMYHPVILNFVKPYLQKTSNAELKEQIEKIRDEIIPFLLTGK
jgi:hypothetical protein